MKTLGDVQKEYRQILLVTCHEIFHNLSDQSVSKLNLWSNYYRNEFNTQPLVKLEQFISDARPLAEAYLLEKKQDDIGALQLVIKILRLRLKSSKWLHIFDQNFHNIEESTDKVKLKKALTELSRIVEDTPTFG